jgi:hypothetical protein
VSLKEYAVSYMRDVTKSFDAAKEVIAKYENMSREMINELSRSYDTAMLDAAVTKLLMK